MMKLIDNIVYCLIVDILFTKKIKQEVLSASLNNTDEDFALKFYKDSNIVVSKTEIHFSLHNLTCFKYRAVGTKKCWFNFLCPFIDQTKVTKLSLINVCQNNL